MLEFSARYDTWHTIQTLVPLAGGALGALFIWHRPAHLGKVVLAYAVACLAVALSPIWVDTSVQATEGAIPEVLLETKFAFIVGLAVILAAGGRSSRDGGRPGAP